MDRRALPGRLSIGLTARDVESIEHVPLLPAADLSLGPLAALSAIAAALATAGVVGFRRRDVPI